MFRRKPRDMVCGDIGSHLWIFCLMYTSYAEEEETWYLCSLCGATKIVKEPEAEFVEDYPKEAKA